MRYIKLKGSEENPYVIDLVTWPDCYGLLYYLEKVAGIEVEGVLSLIAADEFLSRFEFRGIEFEIDTPFSTPLLSASSRCTEEVFCELLAFIDRYKQWNLIYSILGARKYRKRKLARVT